MEQYQERLIQISKTLTFDPNVDQIKRKLLEEEMNQICSKLQFTKRTVDKTLWTKTFLEKGCGSYKSKPTGGWEETKVWQTGPREINWEELEKKKDKEYFNTNRVSERHSKKHVDISGYKIVRIPEKAQKVKLS